MKPWLKRLVAVATLWPVVYMVLFFIFFVWSFTHSFSGSGRQAPPSGLLLIIPLHLFTMLVMFALIGFYAVCVFKLPKLPQDKRVLWLILVLLFGIFAAPVFFWIYLRPLLDDGSLFGEKADGATPFSDQGQSS